MSFPAFKIKKQILSTLALLLALALAASLFGCGEQQPSAAPNDPALVDDSVYALTPEQVETPLDGAGASIALAAGPEGTDSGVGAAVWRGVQTFCENFNFTPQLFVAEEAGTQGAAAALRSAAESGAELVVCYGSDMAAALYTIQDNYPTVSYLCLDDEPHSGDYTDYRTASNVHCVLFKEEQAGYLAGYAAIKEGNTSMAFLGGEPLPGVVRYATGFVQGAEAAAENLGVQAYIRIWYSNASSSSEELTEFIRGWYEEGFQLVMNAGGDLSQSCVDAARAAGRQVIGSGWDQIVLDDAVLTSAVQCYSTVVQNQLYDFWTAREWDQDSAGTTERVGAAEGAIELSLRQWRFTRFTGTEYQDLYTRLRTGEIKVERHSDTTSLPETQNITVDLKNG